MGIESSLLNQQQLKSRLGTDHYSLGVYCEGGALLQPAEVAKGLLESLSNRFGQGKFLSVVILVQYLVN
jgi:hypothetical protein